MIFDAGPQNSPALLRLGPSGRPGAGAGDPTLVQDVFFRIGGATPGQATDSLVVDRSNVILDDIWAWRADHGAGVGWTANVADTGVVVNGDNVTAYGLFAEHYQKYEVIWNGQGGTDIFFQNEMPYDPPSQAAWMASPTQDGYPAFLVTPRVTSFPGYGMGIPIQASTAFLNHRPQTLHATQVMDAVHPQVCTRPCCWQPPRTPGIAAAARSIWLASDLIGIYLMSEQSGGSCPSPGGGRSRNVRMGVSCRDARLRNTAGIWLCQPGWARHAPAFRQSHGIRRGKGRNMVSCIQISALSGERRLAAESATACRRRCALPCRCSDAGV
jgi:hypothetical protein